MKVIQVRMECAKEDTGHEEEEGAGEQGSRGRGRPLDYRYRPFNTI